MVVCTVVIAGTATYLFKTSTTVEELPPTQVKVEETIAWQAGAAQIKKRFKEIKDIQLQGDSVTFVGIDSDVANLYKFNVKDGNLIILHELSRIGYDVKKQSLLAVLYGDYAVFLDRETKRLFTFQDRRKVDIGSVMMDPADGRPSLIMDKEAKRFAFLSSDGKSVTAYHLEKKRKKIIQLKKPVAIEGKRIALEFSFDGEYFSIASTVDDKPQEGRFSVIGTDTGKYYANDVIGIGVVWSPTITRLGFLFTGEIKDDSFEAARLGILDISNRKITYYDQSKPGATLSKTMGWLANGEAVCYMAYGVDGKQPTNHLSVFEIATLTKKNYQVDEVIKSHSPQFIGMGREVGFETVDDGIVRIIDTESQMIKTYRGLDTFSVGHMDHKQRAAFSEKGLLGLDDNIFMNMTVFGTQQLWDPIPTNAEGVSIAEHGDIMAFIQKESVNEVSLIVRKRME